MESELTPVTTGQKQLGPNVVPLQSENALRQFSALLDSSFPVPKGGRFLDDFPIWDPAFQLSSVERWGTLEQGSPPEGGEILTSCAGLRMAQLKGTGGATLSIALIGAVATDARYRGKGLATQVVKRAIRSAVSKRAGLIFLWSSQHSFYRRLGFEFCGQQVQLSLQDLLSQQSKIISSTDTYRKFQIRTGWNPALLSCLVKRTSGLVLNDSDLGWLGAHQNVQWFYIEENGDLQAYAALGRGIDLENRIHEWGGASEPLFAILKEINQQCPQAALLGSPALLRERKFDFAESQVEFLCLGKILDPKQLFDAFYPGMKVRLETAGSGWKIELSEPNGQQVFQLNHQELIHLLLGPYALNPSLPFWIWGLDAA
jgi:GNAT superfamily N-acetyltransferase